MSPDEKRRVVLEHTPEDARPHLRIILDQAHNVEAGWSDLNDFVGFYEDVLDLAWRHLGRPKAGAAPKPYDRPPDEVPKGEQDRRRDGMI